VTALILSGDISASASEQIASMRIQMDELKKVSVSFVFIVGYLRLICRSRI
jgi:hypothetical protein